MRMHQNCISILSNLVFKVLTLSQRFCPEIKIMRSISAEIYPANCLTRALLIVVIQFRCTRLSEFKELKRPHSWFVFPTAVIIVSVSQLLFCMSTWLEKLRWVTEGKRKPQCFSKPNLISQSSWWEGVELFSVLPLTDLGDAALIGWEMRPVLQRAGNGAEILQTFKCSINPFHPYPLLTMTSSPPPRSREARARWEKSEHGKLLYDRVSPRGKKHLSCTASWSEYHWPLNEADSCGKY